MNNNEFNNELLWMQNELMNLKSIQGTINNVESYSYVVNNPAEKVKIIYADGDDDIITRRYIMGEFTWPNAFLTTPHNNVQYILCENLNIEAILLVSTRPILSVENV